MDNGGKKCSEYGIINPGNPTVGIINGSTLSSLGLASVSAYNALSVEKNTPDFNTWSYKGGEMCPWIGYDLFKDGAKDGTYTFNPNTDDETNPYWCFTES